MTKGILFVSLVCVFFISVKGQQLFEMETGQTRWSSFENPSALEGAGGKENKGAKGHAFDVIPPRGSKTLLDYSGAGIVKRIWLTVSERSPVMLRSLRIEMFWDRRSTPAVAAPLGDFFGIGLGRRVPFECDLFSDPEGRSFNCYIPMPFRTGARIVIYNDSNIPVTLFYDVNLVVHQALNPSALYFHAYWNRENKTKAGKDFEVLPKVSGKGRFIGMNVGIRTDSLYGKSWWGEGEVKMYLDGDKPLPTLVGTGTEDYIGTAWGQGKFAHRFQGCPLADEKNRQWSFYRYHVPDPVFFNNGIRITLQQIGGEGTEYVRSIKRQGAVVIPISVAGESFIKLLEMQNPPDLFSVDFPLGWTNFYREDDVSSTAYFYLDRPENGLPRLADLATRVKDVGYKD